MKRHQTLVPAAVFTGTAALYLTFPSALFNFDGVACAIAVELGDLPHLVHGNHLAYGIFSYWIHSAVSVVFPQSRAIYTMQAVNSLLGAAGAALLARILMQAGFSGKNAAAGAAALAVSLVYWRWSIEAQVYPLGAVFLLASILALQRGKPAWAGAFHGLAILGHVGHVMFGPAALFFLKGKNERVKYGLMAASVVVGAYSLAAMTCIRPSSFEDVRVWLLGSAALQVDKSFGWHGGYSLLGLAQWVETSLSLWAPGIPGLLAGAAGWALAVRGYYVNRTDKLAAACGIWLASYAVLFASWEPYTPVYRVTDLPALWLLILLGLKSARRPWLHLWAAAVLLGGWNLWKAMIPGSDPANNASLMRARMIARETPPDAWVLVDGIDQVYVPYFGHRKPLNLRYYDGREAELKKRIAALGSAGEPVYAYPEAIPSERLTRLKAHAILPEGARSGLLKLSAQ